jgi:hypothetical protein
MTDITQFRLKKAKILNDGGLEIAFEIDEVIGLIHYAESKKLLSTKLIHSDLEKAFERFKPHLSSNLGYDLIRKVINASEFEATPKQVQYAEKHYQLMFSSLNVAGVEVSNRYDGIRIVGRNRLNDTPITVITSKLRFDTGGIIGEELEALTGELIKEIWLFITENKVMNPELGFN